MGEFQPRLVRREESDSAPEGPEGLCVSVGAGREGGKGAGGGSAGAGVRRKQREGRNLEEIKRETSPGESGAIGNGKSEGTGTTAGRFLRLEVEGREGWPPERRAEAGPRRSACGSFPGNREGGLRTVRVGRSECTVHSISGARGF